MHSADSDWPERRAAAVALALCGGADELLAFAADAVQTLTAPRPRSDEAETSPLPSVLPTPAAH